MNSKQNYYVTQQIEKILFELGNLKSNETLCIITDDITKDVGTLFYKVAKKWKIDTKWFNIKPLRIQGQEPPKEVAFAMKKHDLILGMTKLSMAHTTAREVASQLGSRYLSLADYSINLLMNEAFEVNFKKLGKKAQKLAETFSKSKTLKIVTEKGTNLVMKIASRKGNFAPGYVNNQLLLGSPPNIEANISPIETESNGIVVVDGSVAIPEIGKLIEPLTLKIRNGYLKSIDGNHKTVKFLNGLFHTKGRKSRLLAECGVGFNDRAKLCGKMLIDEGCYGSVHLGFGSNIVFGGINKIDFHIDFVFYATQLILDNNKMKI